MLEKLTFTTIDIETFFMGSDLGTNILKGSVVIISLKYGLRLVIILEKRFDQIL